MADWRWIIPATIWIVIPLGAMAVGVIMQYLKSKERLAAIEKGIVLPEPPARIDRWGRQVPSDPWERAAGFRVAGTINMGVGLGLLFLFVGLYKSVPAFPEGVIAVSAIPFFVGMALFYEYRVRMRELGPRPTPTVSAPPPPTAVE